MIRKSLKWFIVHLLNIYEELSYARHLSIVLLMSETVSAFKWFVVNWKEFQLDRTV